MHIAPHLLAPTVAISLAILTGCAGKPAEELPDAQLISESSTPSQNRSSNPPAKPKPASTTPPTPAIDDGLRLPNMLALPSDRDLRPTPTTPPADDGGVSARPPVEE